MPLCQIYIFFIQFGMRKKLGSFEICASPVLTQNEDKWNFHSSLTLSNGKPLWEATGMPLCQIWFIFSFCLEWEKKWYFELHISLVLTQNEDIWVFHSSLISNKGKLIKNFRSPWYVILSNMTYFFSPFGIRRKCPVWNYVFHLYWHKMKTFGIFMAHWLWIKRS